MFEQRLARVHAAMEATSVDVALLSVGADLPWLTGYTAMPLERLTMLVVRPGEKSALILPELEAPRVRPQPDVFEVVPWSETADPIALVAQRAAGARTGVIDDRAWARFVLAIQGALPDLRLEPASTIIGPLRARKSPDEIESLRRAAHAADRAMGRIQSGELSVVGRTEADVSSEIARQLVDEGHAHHNFAIVAAGANAASPHHEPGETVITAGQNVLFDIGGTMYDEHGVGYCSDITRNIWLGTPPAEFVDLYDTLRTAQLAQVAAATVGQPCEDVDRLGRELLGSYAEYFVHRTGHGIGVEEHEDPYIVEGNSEPLVAGNAFSIEPGIYIPNKWGARLEDIVVATEDGPDNLTTADNALAVLDV